MQPRRRFVPWILGSTLLVAAVAVVACVQPGGIGMSAPGFAEPAENPLAGAFYNDGGDGDVRARSGNWYGEPRQQGGGASLPPCRPGADELWIFTDGRPAARPAAAPTGPGGGDLVGRGATGQVLPLPLQHTDVHASVRGYLSTVDVTQRFANPYAEKIEAVYVFPLPEDAAVRDFVLQIGERQIRGVIRRKDEAKAVYLQARAQGYRAALLEQARPNVFEQSIANLEPGKAIDVQLRYFHTLAFGSDGYEFVFPMVVGPRYNPAGWTDGIGALPMDQGSGVRQPTNVTYLPPEVRSSHDVRLRVDLDTGLPLGTIGSPSHPIEIQRQGDHRAEVRLAGGSTIPNRDFVLRFQIGGSGHRATLFTQRDGDGGGYLSLLVQPPAVLAELPSQPLELVFLLDCSGSMDGAPLQQLKGAVELALQQLTPSDRFQILAFADRTEAFTRAPVPADAEHLAQARAQLQALRSRGGTEMLDGIRTVLALPTDGERQRHVAFLTDGFIGNEEQVFAAVRDGLGRSRIFGLGIGSSVNRYLLEGVARLGRGAVGYVLHDEPPGRAVAQLYERIRRPALTDLEIDWGGAAVDEVFPARLPDLFVGRPVVLNARFAGQPPRQVRLRGRLGGGIVEFDAVLAAEDLEGGSLLALPALWARRKIQSLSELAGLDGRTADPARGEELALRHGLLSAWTSFLAVDASGRTAGDHGVTVPVAVPVPAGVRYDTTVPGR